MTADEIMSLVSEVLDVHPRLMKKRKANTNTTTARYIAFTIMKEEQLHHSQITDALSLNRIMYYRIQRVVSDRLEYDKDFKIKYLKCIAKIAEMEESI